MALKEKLLPLKAKLNKYHDLLQEFLDVAGHDIMGKTNKCHELMEARYQLQKYIAFNYTGEDLEIMHELIGEIINGDCIFT